MAKSGLELDLLNMDKSSHSPTFNRKRSFRDIQGLISKINPEILKSVIANGCVLDSKKSSLCIPPETQQKVPSVPVCDPTLRLSNWCGENAETAPMTIFYNGTVAVFDVSSHKAQDILKLAEEGGLPKSAECSKSKQTAQYLLHALNGDLPIARRKSLHSFLEKRKERLVMESPYLWPTNGTNPRKSSVPAARD
ncbi:protein TIFY 9-like [Primulina tabacum]|uniref:protein TIFY 9-like n=1 Tax=Primulina tabacum TaxID=48773 RepID=UPI003F59EF70